MKCSLCNSKHGLLDACIQKEEKPEPKRIEREDEG